MAINSLESILWNLQKHLWKIIYLTDDRKSYTEINAVVNITYALSSFANVKLIIYDLTGKQVESLVDKYQSPGYHIIKWHADGYPSGAYFIRMSAADYVDTQKLMFVK